MQVHALTCVPLITKSPAAVQVIYGRVLYKFFGFLYVKHFGGHIMLVELPDCPAPALSNLPYCSRNMPSVSGES